MHASTGACGGQKRSVCPLELELEEVVSTSIGAWACPKTVVSSLQLSVFLHRVLCSSGWLQTYYAAEAGLEIPILLSLPLECWEYWHTHHDHIVAEI